MSDPICSAKHTAFQPTADQWKCPQCGSGNDSFYIEEPDATAIEGCDRLHEQDEVCCNGCGYGASGKMLAKKMMKVHNREICPHCKGEGTVAKS